MYSNLKQREIDRDGEQALDKMLLNLDDTLLATNAKVKGVPSSCIDDDDPKRGKKQMVLQGGCIDIRNHEELVNHSVIVNSAKNLIDGSIVHYSHFTKTKNHTVQTEYCSKVSVNCCNDKVETLSNDFHSRSLGHYLNGKMFKKKELMKELSNIYEVDKNCKFLSFI